MNHVFLIERNGVVLYFLFFVFCFTQACFQDPLMLPYVSLTCCFQLLQSISASLLVMVPSSYPIKCCQEHIFKILFCTLGWPPLGKSHPAEALYIEKSVGWERRGGVVFRVIPSHSFLLDHENSFTSPVSLSLSLK